MSYESLIAGYRRYRDGYYQENRDRLLHLAEQGQSPKVAVVACCDSRVDPAVITGSNPGDIFVVRNVANLVPPCEGEGTWHGTSAALQFAICGLEVEHLIVMGHAQCGGIRSLLERRKTKYEDKFITDWMSLAEKARSHILEREDLKSFDERAHALEMKAIETSLANLETFPWIQERRQEGNLQLHGWYYDMGSGELLQLDPQQDTFVPIQ